MNFNARLIVVDIVILICLGGCGKNGPLSPEPPSQTGSATTPPTAPPPAPPGQPTAGELASLSGMYHVNAAVFEADPSVDCDPRRTGDREMLRVDLRVDGNSRAVEGDLVRGGQLSHLHGTVADQFAIRVRSVSESSDPNAPPCPGQANVTLSIYFGGPNFDGCQGYTGTLETEYDFAPGKIRERFTYESC